MAAHPNLVLAHHILLIAEIMLKDAKELLARLEEVQARNEELLSANSQAILGRAIDEELRLAEAKQARHGRFYTGYPGVPTGRLEGNRE
jgi:hypothetical protein